jgi:hypothetical protein
LVGSILFGIAGYVAFRRQRNIAAHMAEIDRADAQEEATLHSMKASVGE